MGVLPCYWAGIRKEGHVPESNRTICALSAPVTVFTDELMSQLVLKLPKEECASLLQNSLTRAQERLLAQTVRNRKSDAYKAELIVRRMAERVRPLPESLATLLGEKPVEPIVATAPPEDDFAADIDIPEFKQYSDVFCTYPYWLIRKTEQYGTLLVLGYSSGLGRESKKLFRRNCLVVMPDGRRINFRHLVSTIGVLTQKGPDDTHYTIKAIPLVDGMGIKFWTNIIKEGDLLNQYRYIICDRGFGTLSGAVNHPSEAAWEEALGKYRVEGEFAHFLTDEQNPC